MATRHPDNSLSLNDLENLSIHELQAAYEAVFLAASPQRASVDFLRGNIAWALQAREAKQNPATLRQALLKRINRSSPQQVALCKVGTRFIREWQGHTHEVTVLEKGYLWQGEHYRSLSRIAREITGTRWSGPRFFGLKETDG